MIARSKTSRAAAHAKRTGERSAHDCRQHVDGSEIGFPDRSLTTPAVNSGSFQFVDLGPPRAAPCFVCCCLHATRIPETQRRSRNLDRRQSAGPGPGTSGCTACRPQVQRNQIACRSTYYGSGRLNEHETFDAHPTARKKKTEQMMAHPVLASHAYQWFTIKFCFFISTLKNIQEPGRRKNTKH